MIIWTFVTVEIYVAKKDHRSVIFWWVIMSFSFSFQDFRSRARLWFQQKETPCLCRHPWLHGSRGLVQGNGIWLLGRLVQFWLYAVQTSQRPQSFSTAQNQGQAWNWSNDFNYECRATRILHGRITPTFRGPSSSKFGIRNSIGAWPR